MDLGPSPVSWTVVPRFNRVGSYILEKSKVALLGGLLTLDLFNIVIEKLSLSLYDYYGIRQRNRDFQANGIPRCQWEPRRRFQRGYQGKIKSVRVWFFFHEGSESRQKKSSTRFEKDERFAVRELGTTGGPDSDESIFAEPWGLWQRKTKAVYEKSPIKPEKFPGKDFNRWELWVKHYKSVAKANG